MSNWQPISTVPEKIKKEGKHILLLWEGKVIEGFYQTCPDNEAGFWKPIFLDYHGCGCCGNGAGIGPTHWQELEIGC